MIRFRFFPHSHATVPRREEREEREGKKRRGEEKKREEGRGHTHMKAKSKPSTQSLGDEEGRSGK